MASINRRSFLSYLSSTAVTPFLTLSLGFIPQAQGLSQPSSWEQADSFFPFSVTSGDPTDTGVILWTRLNPTALNGTESLFFEISTDIDFSQPVFLGEVKAEEISFLNDYTVKVDLDGQLQPNRFYYYRFIYGSVTSRIGRARTAPSPGMQVDSLKFGLVTCQDLSSGYYDALRHLAEQSDIDYVLHLGDFIYEYEVSPRSSDSDLSASNLVTTSGRASTLEEFRTIYKAYRSDQHLLRAMENHTWIMTTDDHETSNNCYWDYERDTLGAPDHVFTEQQNFEGLFELKRGAQQAWMEYTPSRVYVDWNASHPHQFNRIYRRFYFGDLVDLYMLDTRTYRDAHACGEETFLQIILPLGCSKFSDENRSILGNNQRDWLLNGLAESTSKWRLLGNQTFMARLGLELGNFKLPLNMDAWDGFWHERQQLLRELQSNGVNNLIVATGDMHTHICSNLKIDHADVNPFNENNYVGAEFMTPSVTSEGLVGIITNILNLDIPSNYQPLFEDLITAAVRVTNPHIRFFDSFSHGYSTLEFTNDYCQWDSYAIDKTIPSDTQKHQVASYRKYEAYPWVMKQDFQQA